MFVPFLCFVFVNFQTICARADNTVFKFAHFLFPLTSQEWAVGHNGFIDGSDWTDRGPPCSSEQGPSLLVPDQGPCLLVPVGLIRVLPAGPCWSLCFYQIYSCPSPGHRSHSYANYISTPTDLNVCFNLYEKNLLASFVNPVVPFPPSLPSCQKSYRHRNTLHILSNCRELKGSPWEIFWK